MGGIDAAVIASEGNFAQVGHFAVAHLVQDLAGFRVSLGLDAVAWVEARKCSTPFAMLGSSHRVMSAVIMPSRPKGVLNHGVPA
jgi:hypothetical protein